MFSAFPEDALEAEVFEQLRQQQLEARRRRYPRWWRAAGYGAVAAGTVLMMTVGIAGNVNFAEDFHHAEAAYDDALTALDTIYAQNRAAANDLSADIVDAQSFVASSRGAAEEVNGWVDPQPLADLVVHANMLAATVKVPPAAAVRLVPKGGTTPELESAALVAKKQAESNREALATTKQLISEIIDARQQTRSSLTSVATSALSVAQALVNASRASDAAAQDQFAAAVNEVGAALQNGSGVADAIVAYARSAKAFSAADSDDGSTPTPIMATVDLSVAAVPAVQQAANSAAPPAPAPAPKTPAANASAGKPAASATPTAQAAPPAKQTHTQAGQKPQQPSSADADLFTVEVHPTGPASIQCQHSVAPIGGGVYFGARGTTQKANIHYNEPYTYTLTQTSPTTVALIVYACKR